MTEIIMGSSSFSESRQPDLALTRDRTGLLVIDFQERLVRAMPEERAAAATRNTTILIETARRLGLPVVATEQYPEGLGPTIEPIAAALGTLTPACSPISKLEFSALGAPEAIARMRETGRSAWIVAGMETHVCVYQSVRAICAGGAAAHVVADACLSRKDASWERGLALMERAGAIVTTTEVVVFDLLGRAGTEDFKALSRLVK